MPGVSELAERGRIAHIRVYACVSKRGNECVSAKQVSGAVVTEVKDQV